MHSIYAFVSGPLAWLAFIIFIGGCLYRLISLMVLVHRKEKFIYSYMSLKYSLRSIFRWSMPFATENMRRHPALTIVAFAFHICLILTPLFLLAHVTLVEESWNTDEKRFELNFEDEIIKGCVITHGGKIVNEMIAKHFADK